MPTRFHSSRKQLNASPRWHAFDIGVHASPTIKLLIEKACLIALPAEPSLQTTHGAAFLAQPPWLLASCNTNANRPALLPQLRSDLHACWTDDRQLSRNNRTVLVETIVEIASAFSAWKPCCLSVRLRCPPLLLYFFLPVHPSSTVSCPLLNSCQRLPTIFNLSIHF